MDFQIISTTARSVTLERAGDTCFFSSTPYAIYLDGVETAISDRNVYTLYGLLPGNRYDVQLKDQNTGEMSPVYSLCTEEEPLTLDVRSFGAKGDGVNLDTVAIQAAIAACPPYGRVLVPEGQYLVTALFLKSRMTLEIVQGATLLGSTDRSLYPILPGIVIRNDNEEHYLGSWEGDPQDAFASMITGIDVEEVNLIGAGVLNGQASYENWWADAKVKRIAWRPRMVFLKNTRDFLMEGLTVMNSPSWNIHPMFSRNLRFLNLTILSEKDSPNTDGLNPESSKNVLIAGVRFSVGDDCIALKSGKIYLGRKLKTSSENITIRNCQMADGHGAIVIGSEMAGGIENVSVTQCLFQSTDRGIRIKTRRGRGKDGVVRNIKVENIRMEKVLTPFVINMFYYCDPDGKTEYVWSKELLPVDEGTPRVENIRFKNIEATDAEVSAGFFYGLPEEKIQNLHLEDITVSFSDEAREDFPAMMSHLKKSKKSGMYLGNISGVTMKNVVIHGQEGETLLRESVEKMENL